MSDLHDRASYEPMYFNGMWTTFTKFDNLDPKDQVKILKDVSLFSASVAVGLGGHIIGGNIGDLMKVAAFIGTARGARLTVPYLRDRIEVGSMYLVTKYREFTGSSPS